LLLWASPTWHKWAPVFVIVGVAMATACRYKPCPGDTVMGEQGTAQETVLLYWHDLFSWPVLVSGVYPFSCFCRKFPHDRVLMHLVIIFYIYIGLCAFQVLYKHKLIHLIFSSHDSCLQRWVGLIRASQTFQQWNCYLTNYLSKSPWRTGSWAPFSVLTSSSCHFGERPLGFFAAEDRKKKILEEILI